MTLFTVERGSTKKFVLLSVYKRTFLYRKLTFNKVKDTYVYQFAYSTRKDDTIFHTNVNKTVIREASTYKIHLC